MSTLLSTKEKLSDEEANEAPTTSQADLAIAEHRASISTSSQSELTAVVGPSDPNTPPTENEKNEEKSYQVGWDGPDDIENPQVHNPFIN